MVLRSVEKRKFVIVETNTHKYKVEIQRALNLVEKEKLLYDVQKRMKQIVEFCNGELWEQSVKEIVSEIISFLQEINDETKETESL